MPKPVAVITADTHLDERGAWPSRPDINGDAEYSFEQLVDAANKNKVPLILAGDIFDRNRPDSATVQFFADQLNRLDPGPCYFVQGNHDFSDPPWPLISKKAVWLEKECYVALDKLVCCGFDYASAAELPERIAEIPKETTVLVTHQAWKQFVGGKFPTSADLEDLPDHIRIAISGDIHVHLDLKVRKFRALSPGSISMRKISEATEKRYFLLYDNFETMSIPLNTRHVYNMKLVAGNEDLEILLTELRGIKPDKHLPEKLRKPLIRVPVYTEMIDAGAAARIDDAIADKAHLFLNEIQEQDEKIVAERKKRHEIMGSAGLVGCLGMVIQDQKSDLYRLCYSLLDAKNPYEMIEKMKAELVGADGSP